jgi:hypothetical protein
MSRAIYLVELRAGPSDTGVRDLRRLLKVLLRHHGMHCIGAREIGQPPKTQTISRAAGHRRRQHGFRHGGGQRRTPMSIGKRKTSGGDFLPRFKIDGRSAAMSMEDRVKEDGEWTSKSQNVPYGKFRAIIDIANIERGYVDFTSRKPDMKFFRLGEDIGDPPSKNHKEGLRVLLQMSTSLGGGVRELISTAIGVYNAFDKLHDNYEKGLVDHPDCLPIVECDGIHEEKLGNGTSAAPIWRIVRWVPRPPELPVDGIPLPNQTAKAADAENEEDHEMAEAIAARSARKKTPMGRSGTNGGHDDMDDEIPF